MTDGSITTTQQRTCCQDRR